ncbi:linoleate 13S-lipoxygenase 3-1, chloroplastic-like isoform X2 [Henckelia pumila]|uniref:linoleate 13S-lipoxygenase 3-1, chloroplastic-like isoform X2 n=1 Tax=Henckelia pumila TaxID=405737 RepID=UPI003C6E4A35
MVSHIHIPIPLMALAKEMMGSSLLEKTPFLATSSSSSSSRRLVLNQRRLLFPFQQRAMGMGRSCVVVKAAISEDLELVKSVPHKALKFKVRAVLSVRNKNKEDFKDTLVKHLDALTDKIGRNVVLELVSNDFDPTVLQDWSKKSNLKTERVNYVAEFMVDSNFGIPGAILVSNKHQQEFFLESITVEGFPRGALHFPCDSWVQSNKGKRVFFSNQAYLPHETPAGLKGLREKELRELRGDGNGERKLCDRIYDFDVYNDLGNPDKGIDFARPILGGQEIPYPRRCRTGRPATYANLKAESRVEKPLPMYVPRDEQFEESKMTTFSTGRLKAVLHNLIPQLMATISANNKDFKGFSDIDSLYSQGLLLKLGLHDEILNKMPIPEAVNKIQNGGLLKFDLPKIVSKDKHAWLRDHEFGRQALAGVNPVNIQRLQAFPPLSKLDPQTYGSPESALKDQHISDKLNGMTIQEALNANRLYIIDYHDIYLPFLDGMNALDGRKSYATRTVFFLTDLGTLKPIAIELSLPPTTSSSPPKRVVTPPVDATTYWMWQLAKAHVCSNDAGVHQLVNHWLRTHAALEPFILAAHRQMSAMHPIFKLLDPHMRYTLEINALARQGLINVDGVIESCFTPGRYCMEISAAAYKSSWRFDMESLPADLIRRGMAVRDPTQPHGLKLVMDDYPYAADGLMIWGAIEKWVHKYVAHYYQDANQVCNDKELQAWYAESINVGHADLRHEDWWPTLATPEDLASIITTIIWLASAQHAALNFGQYPYGGYIPNRPPLVRRLIPDENDPEYSIFLTDPQKYFFCALPSLLQATKFMAVVDTLSTHSPDEEYLGERNHQSIWSCDPEVIEAFYEFSSEIRGIEKEIEKRNADPKRRNRCGAGVLPYELLAPSSEPGVTCRGVPNSVSI